MVGKVRIGLSGWSYRHWRGEFYPNGLAARKELAYTVARFSTLEINRSFYSLVTPATYQNWYQTAPRGFRYAIKGSRFITHNKKLANVKEPLANFFASGVLELREKLGPILWQVSAGLKPDLERLASFLDLLPTDSEQAAGLARRHTNLGREVAVTADRVRPLRHVLEFRSADWFVTEISELARVHNVALAISHSSRWPTTGDVTADFVYVRLHGPRQLYASRYREEELKDWASRIVVWAAATPPLDVYVYFDNDGHAFAPRQALELKALINV